MHDELTAALAAAAARRDVTSYRPLMIDPDAQDALTALLAEPGIIVVDTMNEQLEELVRSRDPRAELTQQQLHAAIARLLEGRELSRFGAWAYYPWLARLVRVLPQDHHRELRLDRNRYKISPAEQERLLSLRVAVAGLSVGRAVVSTLVREGIGGEIRLADFDALSLSNLNRVAGGLVDVGVSKVVLAAREIAELDPYVRVTTFLGGVQEETLAAFVDGADVIVDECDDLSMKLVLREAARRARLPLIMATSDRGMLDIERFDLEPERPSFHGILSGVDAAELQGLTTRQKIPYILRVLDAERLEARMAASLVEVKETLSTWPQLASGVVLGGAMVANAVRRIALGELTCSGRFHADLDLLVAEGQQAALPAARPFHAQPAAVGPARLVLPAPPRSAGAGGAPAAPSREEMRFLVACATHAPSGGNIQPWRFTAQEELLRAFVDPERSPSLLNYSERATHLALGAALEGAVIGARALGFAAEVRPPGASGAAWELRLRRGAGPGETESLRLLSERCTNRKAAPSPVIAEGVLGTVAARGAPLDVLAVPHERLERLGAALGALDRVRFLSPRFRHELFSEVRWTREEALARRDGIDVASLELDATDLAVMEVLRSGAGMAMLTALGHGRALGNGTRAAFAKAGGALVLRAARTDSTSLLEAGRGLMRLWLEATRLGLAVHPWGSPFLFQRLHEADDTLEAWERETLAAAARAFEREVPLGRELPTLLVLRLSRGEEPSGRSVRRDVDDVLAFPDGDGI